MTKTKTKRPKVVLAPFAVAGDEYRLTMRDIRDSLKRGERVDLSAYYAVARQHANRAAQLLGHIAMRCGESAECPRCGASGFAGEVLTGKIFTAACGANEDAERAL